MSSKVNTNQLRLFLVVVLLLTVVFLASFRADWVGSASAQTVPTPTLEGSPPVPSPTIAPTPSITAEPTPFVISAIVTDDCICRSGPGLVYDELGALIEGDVVVVIGQDGSGAYWYIENPNQPGQYCWMGRVRARMLVDDVDLPVITPSPIAACAFDICEIILFLLILAILLLILLGIIIALLIMLLLLLRNREEKEEETKKNQPPSII